MHSSISSSTLFINFLSNLPNMWPHTPKIPSFTDIYQVFCFGRFLNRLTLTIELSKYYRLYWSTWQTLGYKKAAFCTSFSLSSLWALLIQNLVYLLFKYFTSLIFIYIMPSHQPSIHDGTHHQPDLLYFVLVRICIR